MSKYKTRIFFLNCAVIAILMATCVQNTRKNDVASVVRDVSFILSFFTVLFIACDFALRLCYWLAHIVDNDVTSDTDIAPTILDAFTFNIGSVILIVASTVLFLALIVNVRGWPMDYVWRFDALTILPCILLSWILLRLTGFSTWNLRRSPSVSSMKGLDYGTGMAYSFFYGYLKIILPATGTAVKGLIEKIENLEDSQNVTMATQKLVILIPSSSYIPPDLKDVSYQWMESASHLEDEQRDRAGVKRRVYRNNIYKIYPGGINSGSTPLYIVAEGATPLLTFFEVQKHVHPETNIYKRYHVEIVKTFYTKLKELLDSDLDCRDLCELIYYDDYDSNGVKVNVAKVILNRLPKMTSINGI